MDVIRTLKPTENGAKRFAHHYGDKLVAVRWRKSGQGKKLITVELVVDEQAITPGLNKRAELEQQKRKRVPLKVGFEEKALQQEIKAAGGKWDASRKVWWLGYQEVVNLQLRDRMVKI